MNKALRPGQILEAACEVFAQHGYAEARLDDIAKRAEVSKGLIYVYYPTKIDLFHAAAQSLIEPLTQWHAKIELRPDQSAHEVLALMQDFHYQHMCADPKRLNFLKLILTESDRVPEIADFFAKNLVGMKNEFLHRVIKHGIERGEFPATALEKITGIEDILGSPGLMLSLTQMMSGQADLYDVDKWKKAHLGMVINYLKYP